MKAFQIVFFLKFWSSHGNFSQLLAFHAIFPVFKFKQFLTQLKQDFLKVIFLIYEKSKLLWKKC